MESEFQLGLVKFAKRGLCLSALHHLLGYPDLPSGEEGWAEGRGECHFLFMGLLV